MQSRRVPVTKLRRVEEIYPSVLRGTVNCIDLRSSEQNAVIHMQLEGVSVVTEEENREPTTSALTDLGNCVCLIRK